MFNLITKYLDKYRSMKKKRAEEVIREIKLRYHTFRIILINNERALKVMNEIDLLLKKKRAFIDELGSRIEELIEISYELVDGLNRLSDDSYSWLYEMHSRVSESIRSEIPELPVQPDEGVYCLLLDEITQEMKRGAGGKAGALSDLKRISIPVPDGFVITIDGCRRFFQANEIERPIRRILREIEADESLLGDLDNLTAKIRDMILSATLPEDLEKLMKEAYQKISDSGSKALSVRSSASVEDQGAHSFAGQFKTLLNIVSFDDLVTAFKEVVASNFNSRSIIYRSHSSLTLVDFDMAVLCQVMVKAKSAGVLFTVDPSSPENERMLISAVSGLGSLAVGGDVATDLYHPVRSGSEDEIVCEIAEKDYKEICSPEGGVSRVRVSDDERERALLTPDAVRRLSDLGRIIESFTGKPQDIEWAMAEDGSISILQSRPFRSSRKRGGEMESLQGEAVLQGGVTSSPGRGMGKVRIIHSSADLEEPDDGHMIAVLHQSLVEAARAMRGLSGIVVDKGSPADHLSNVAREYGVPMLTRTESATSVLKQDQWVVLDADRCAVYRAPEDALRHLSHRSGNAVFEEKRDIEKEAESEPSGETSVYSEKLNRLRKKIIHLNLTDAYGPSFSILECRSIHDLIRYIHEMAVMEMFSAGDLVMEEAGKFIHRLDGSINFHFLIIDMGGGLTPGDHPMKISPEDIISSPLLSLWRGASTPGLRWNVPPPAPSLSGLFGKGITDKRSVRPLGNCNYALIARDYLNLNARLDFHFTMVDTICGRVAKENYIRFRFKGGGTTQIQRERRVKLISEILERYDFFTDSQGDLLTAVITEMEQGSIERRLEMLGRLLGFIRLIDAMMHSDDSPKALVEAFMSENYSLEHFEN